MKRAQRLMYIVPLQGEFAKSILWVQTRPSKLANNFVISMTNLQGK